MASSITHFYTDICYLPLQAILTSYIANAYPETPLHSCNHQNKAHMPGSAILITDYASPYLSDFPYILAIGASFPCPHATLQFLALPFPILALFQKIDDLVQTANSIRQIECGEGWVLIPHQNKLIHNNTPDKYIELTEKEAHVLEMLANSPSHEVTSKALLETVWGYKPDGIHTHTLQSHIYRLRQKLASFPDTPSINTTEIGYKLGHTI